MNTILEKIQELAQHHDKVTPELLKAKDIKLESATKNLPIPLHPGAERFYKEAGVL